MSISTYVHTHADEPFFASSSVLHKALGEPAYVTVTVDQGNLFDLSLYLTNYEHVDKLISALQEARNKLYLHDLERSLGD